MSRATCQLGTSFFMHADYVIFVPLFLLLAQDVIGRSIIYAREKPMQATAYGGGIFTLFYMRSVAKSSKNDSLGPKAVFVHPENRAVRDEWGYLVANDAPPMFRSA